MEPIECELGVWSAPVQAGLLVLAPENTEWHIIFSDGLSCVVDFDNAEFMDILQDEDRRQEMREMLMGRDGLGVCESEGVGLQRKLVRELWRDE